MKNGKDKKNRRLDISIKLIEMGQSLLVEGEKENDFSIIQTGSFMVLMGTIIMDEKDVYDFGQLCSMFSAKRLLDMADSNQIKTLFTNMGENETYLDYIKRINKLRGGEPPIN